MTDKELYENKIAVRTWELLISFPHEKPVYLYKDFPSDTSYYTVLLEAQSIIHGTPAQIEHCVPLFNGEQKYEDFRH